MSQPLAPRASSNNPLRVPTWSRSDMLTLPIGRKIGGLEHLADLNLAVDERGAAGPLDRRLLRRHLDHPESGDQLVRRGERRLPNARLAAGEDDARALRARLQALARQHDAGLD